VIGIASSELMLHTLVLSNSPVTAAEVRAQMTDYGPTDDNSVKIAAAYSKIHGIKTQVIKTGFPVLWGVLAFVFLIIGIKKKAKALRIVALALLGITILKLFLFDIKNASETGKIVAFILLGVLILIISFVYQKIKVLVLDDKPISNESE
jgi:heme/copper-type cytochrome/quinol oxidase subunit 4